MLIWTRLSKGPARIPALGLIAALLALVPVGCDGGGSGDGGGTLLLTNFNLDGLRGVFLNEDVVFTFSTDIDPSSVNPQTIQLRFDGSVIDRNDDNIYDEPGNTNAVPAGTFEVSGNRVIFHPKLPTRPSNNDGGFPPSHVDDVPTFQVPPGPAVQVDVLVTVFVPAFPNTNTVQSTAGRPVASEFRSSFTMVDDPVFPPTVSPSSFVDTNPGVQPQLLAIIHPTTTTDVSVNTCVQLRFSEPLLPSSVTGETIFLSAIGPSTGQTLRVSSAPGFDQEPSGTSHVTLYPGSADGCTGSSVVPLAGNVLYRVNFTSELTGFGENNEVELPTSPVEFMTRPTQQQSSLILESFDTQVLEDPAATGATWGASTAPSQLLATAGGTGEDGPLTPTADTVINTDQRPGDPNAFPVPIPPGTFNWTTIVIPQNVTVRIVGSNPLRARAGNALIQGRLNLSGLPGGAVTTANPGAAGVGGNGGPGAGRGGDGGVFTDTPTPGPGNGVEDGTDGTSPAPGNAGAGRGSQGFTGTGTGQEAGGAGGGGYGTNGSTGNAQAPNPGAAGGNTYGASNLYPEQGNFLAGSGGGGAGNSMIQNNPSAAGSGGGGGGGALELITGQETKFETLTGALFPAGIVADGGAGGRGEVIGGFAFPATGGGGSGGAILLRSVGQQILQHAANTPAGRCTFTAGGGSGGFLGASPPGGPGSGGNGGLGRINFQALGGRVNMPTTTLPIVNPPEMPAMDDMQFQLDGNYSFATSRWIDTQKLFPDYTFNRAADAVDNSQRFSDFHGLPPDTIVQYEFQGTTEDPLIPGQPDPDATRPGLDRFTTDINEVDDSRFIRFRVIFLVPNPNQLAPEVPLVDQLRINLTSH